MASAPALARPRAARLALPLLCAAELLVALDGMVVAVALPSIQRDLVFTAAAFAVLAPADGLALVLAVFAADRPRAAGHRLRRGRLRHRCLAAGALALLGALAAGLLLDR